MFATSTQEPSSTNGIDKTNQRRHEIIISMIHELEPPIIRKKTSNNPGKQIAIIVGVHGNEKGPQLEWDWLNDIRIKSGTLHLIFANPTASKLNRRFVNINLNRRFGNGLAEYPEDELAREIEKVLDSCDTLLDLHMYNEPMDRPFAICNHNSNRAAQTLPVNYIVNLPDDAGGGGTDDYMAMKGKAGVCFETGSSERPQAYSKVIRQGVLSFLASFGMVDHEVMRNENAHILIKNSTKFVTKDDLIFSKNYSSFDPIKQGEIICTEDGKSYTATHDGYILFPRPHNPVGTEAYYTLISAKD